MQQGRHLRELALIFEIVRHDREAAVGPAPDEREEAGGTRTLRIGQRLDPALEIGFGRGGGIEIRAFRFWRSAWNEPLIVIEPRPRSFVDQEVVQPGATLGRLVLRQVEQHGLVTGPDLPQKQRVDNLRRLDQLCQHTAIRGGDRRQVGANLGRRKLRGHLPQLPRIGHTRLLGDHDSREAA